MMPRRRFRVTRLGGAVVAVAFCVSLQFRAHASQFLQADLAEIERQVARLSDSDWLARRDAVRTLVRIGPPVEARLRELLASGAEPEACLRAMEVLRRVDPLRRTEPAMFNLNLEGVDAKTAFDQVARIEGAAIAIDPPGLLDQVTERVTAHFDHQCFWNVVLELCRQTGLRLRCDQGGVAVVRSRGPRPSQCVAVSGMFLVAPTWLAGFNEVGPGVRISLYAEPRARVLAGGSPFTLAEAIDARGRSCLSESSMNAGGLAVGNGYSWSAGLAPKVGADSVIARCRGTARMIVAETFQTVEAPGFASSKSLADPMPIRLSAGGVSANVMRIINVGGEYQMDVQLSTDPAEVDWNALLFSIRSGGMRSFDLAGNELTLLGVQCEGGGPTNNLRCRWATRGNGSARLAGQPFKLVWQVPARTVGVAVPFELKDVTLH